VTDDAANAAGMQRRGRPFKKGRSGNPAGKAKGIRHRTTMTLGARHRRPGHQGLPVRL
jgi:hypothetical protein